jgi:nucleotide-binding universal stress UspA family protein
LTLQKKILVLTGPCREDLKSVHYTMALAERLEAQVYVFQIYGAASSVSPDSVWLAEALADLISSARRAGLDIKQHIVRGALKDEIVSLVRQEGIDVLVSCAEIAQHEHLLLQVKPHVSCQIIQVKEKDHVDYL